MFKKFLIVVLTLLNLSLVNNTWALGDDELDSSDPFSIISKEDYKDLKISPLYKDSIVKLYPNLLIVEEKTFENGVSMQHFISNNVVLFVDLDSDNPKKEIFNIICNVDKITDAKTCSLINHTFHYVKRSDKLSFLVVGKNMDLNNTSYIRIDKNPAFKSTKGAFYRPTLDNVLKQMVTGNNLYVRYHNKYNYSSIDDESSLKGFSVAYNTLNLLYLKLK